MRQFAATILLTLCAAVSTNAQSFTSRLQKPVKGQGTVTIHHSAAIDELINGTSKNNTPQTTARQQTSANKQDIAVKQDAAEKNKHAVSSDKDDTLRNNRQKNTDGEKPDSNTGTGTPDIRKKVMANSRKVNGYRVQVYAGGNKREDRQRAQQAGNDIKTNFPDEPVYVHFYSPRWICRVGNYRTYEEAHRMLTEIRKLGYKQASIVKGKISIQY
ncbi:SPOR domain-containing protein [Xylanibacter muris]|uniref:SPOR domain-containing protein n=1 Tax=Xylanibacter muris TaxID=2736290 RepID=A0ABX2AKZ8_9BACT|nr:SPOR domain-containing protein [Xylanibacter muris]NPD91879.1 SPOR domain-containing protein [Xylanibacter muris]